jgi:hypothetical protein
MRLSQEAGHLRKLLEADDDGVSPDDFPVALTATGMVGFHSEHRVRFAAPLFRVILIQRFYSSKRPLRTVLGFDDFIKATIRGMDPNKLLRSFSRNSAGAPVYERHWKMEFYRAATSLLASEHSIAPDVGPIFGVAGFMDFYVDGGLKWGIELLREGDREENHARRSENGAAYFKLLDTHITEFVITPSYVAVLYSPMIEPSAACRFALIDFRAHDNTKLAKQFLPNFWYIFYSADYRTATVKRLGFEDEELPIAGLVRS